MTDRVPRSNMNNENVIPIISIDIKCIIIAGSIRAVCYYSVIRVIAI